jgi:hypothetical protein
MTADSARQITEVELTCLSTDNIAYFRPVRIDNKLQFMLMARDGPKLGVAPNYQTGIRNALENDFKPVSAH